MQLNPHKYTILVADDSPPEQQLITQTLQHEHFKVVSTARASEVIPLSQKVLPDIIVLCLLNDVLEALNILIELKGQRQTRYTPVMFLTSTEEHEDFRHILDLDNVDIMPQTLQHKALVARIHYQLLLTDSLRTIDWQNKKLKEEMQAKETFYSVIAHDLRSPIGTSKMILEALNEKIELIEEPSIKQMLRMLTDTTNESFSLLENLLLWSRSQRGSIEADIQPINIKEAVQEVVNLQENVAMAKEITLNNHILRKVTAFGDVNMVKTILRNLISNAIKFSWPDSSIDIRGKKRNDELIISIQDHGQGISAENQEKLREADPHFTTQGTGKEKGSGLGLQLVRNFIRMNGGTFWFESEEGKGTTFFFTLPTVHKEIRL